MATELFPDALLANIEPLLSAHKPSSSLDGEQPWVPDRAALTVVS